MVSKSLKPENNKLPKTLDFIHYYKAAADSNITLKKDVIPINNYPSDASTSKNHPKKTSKCENVIVTKIDIDGPNLVTLPRRTSPSSGCKLTSASILSNEKIQKKSTIKDTPNLANSLDLSYVPKVNRKKRNKPVSFIFDDNDAVVVKKTKPDESLIPKTEKGKHSGKNNKAKEDKENDVKMELVSSEHKFEVFESGKTLIHKTEKNSPKNTSKPAKKQIIEMKQKDLTHIAPPEYKDKSYGKTENIKKETILKNIKSAKPIKNNEDTYENTASTLKKNMIGIDVPIFEKPNKKKKKQNKVIQDFEKTGPTDTNGSNNAKQNSDSIGIIKNSKRLRKHKQHEGSEMEEPDKKTFKNSKDDNIAEGIENLNIGDNAHSLTNLLDEMRVTKTKKQINQKDKDVANPIKKPEEKPKLNRNNRKRKNRNINSTVLVQNLPFKILLSYKLKLREFFSKYGTVQSIGIADLKCNQDEAQPIFTTRVFFQTEEEATAALDGDKELFEGNIIRVKKFMLHPTRTFRPSSWSNRNKRKREIHRQPNM